MNPAAALTAENFSVISIFMQADWIVRSVMILLASASIWSWTIIISKFMRFTTINREADTFEATVGSGRSLGEVAADAGDNPPQPLPRMLQAALHEWREARAKGSLNDIQIGLLIQRIDRGLDNIAANEMRRVENGLGSLAIVATSSPFIGLFGTVWGIMTAFQAIAIQRNTNLAVVAPSIAEALFATALGLVAAIPAYVAYNKFSVDAGKFAGRLESFADELTSAVTRRLGEKAGPQPVQTTARAPVAEER
jgi:biopolymer transport protein TolQ